jgi:hypothetical protein
MDSKRRIMEGIEPRASTSVHLITGNKIAGLTKKNSLAFTSSLFITGREFQEQVGYP